VAGDKATEDVRGLLGRPALALPRFNARDHLGGGFGVWSYAGEEKRTHEVHITRDILPERSAEYKKRYDQRITRHTPPEGRDYLTEVIRSLQQAPGGPEERAHKINWLITLEDLLAHQQQGG
jgi:hypothetical protein